MAMLRARLAAAASRPACHSALHLHPVPDSRPGPCLTCPPLPLLPQLDLLDLSGTGLTAVPSWMSALLALTDLQLASNELQVGRAAESSVSYYIR